MNTPYGVTVSVSKNGLAIEPSAKGYLGTAYAGDEFVMDIHLEPLTDIAEKVGRLLVVTNRERQCARLLEPITGESYRHVVPVITPVNGGKYDRDDANKNCVHLVTLSEQGKLQVVNIVVSGQDGEFFLVCHPTYTAQVYSAELGIAIPDLWVEPGFPALVPFVEAYYLKNPTTLPSLTTYVAKKEEIDQSVLDGLPDDNHMVVKFWSVRTGTGGAVRKNGELVKVYWKNLNVADRCPRHLLESEIIRANRFRPNKGMSKMALEAMGITRVEFENA